MKKITLLLLISLTSYYAFSQKTSFTTQDVLDVKSFSVMDINDDARLVAGIIRARKDRLNIDHARYGDPNYVAPYSGEIVIIDTEEGTNYRVFDTKIGALNLRAMTIESLGLASISRKASPSCRTIVA